MSDVSPDLGDPTDARRVSDSAGTAALVESASQIVSDSESGPPATSVLPTVLSDVPVAILLIDLDDRTVTYANRLALAMANQPLPVPVDQWGAAAGLTDLSGEPLESSASPLSRVATGAPVAGEAVRVPAGAAGESRLLWVSGFPLAHSEDVEQLALVVFLEVAASEDGTAEREAALATLRDRAIIATDLAFTITDPTKADNPLAWVNPAFTRATGYSAEESVGRNCRFLQGPATDRAVLDLLRQAVRDQVPVTLTLLNYRKDGTAFWNQLSVSPVFDGQDRLVSFVGVQADVTERVRAEVEREKAYAAEREARHDSERARQRLGLLAEASRQLASTLDVDETLERLADLVVPGLADWVVISVADGQGGIRRRLLRHRAGQERLLSRYEAFLATALTEESGTARILSGAEPILVEDTADGAWRSYTSSDELQDIVEELGLTSVIYVPLLARRRQILGSMTLVGGSSGRHYTEEDLDVAADLGRRAGLTMDNARLYEHEHHTAETLQRSLLPAIGDVDGLRVATRYLPGDSGADVGGDFYELLPLPDGTYGVAAGDVVGHDLAAAAAMGQLRGLLRAAAWTHAEDRRTDPGQVLDRVDRLVQGLEVASIATMVFGRLSRPITATGPWSLSYSSAGHPPLLLRHPDGTVDVLDRANGMLLGVSAEARRSSETIDVPIGSVLVAFTDGLVERRGDDIDEGVRRAADALSSADPDDLETLADLLVATAGDERDDDTAVIAIRVAPPQAVRD